jgi:hypothetical protein
MVVQVGNHEMLKGYQGARIRNQRLSIAWVSTQILLMVVNQLVEVVVAKVVMLTDVVMSLVVLKLVKVVLQLVVAVSFRLRGELIPDRQTMKFYPFVKNRF